MRYSNRITFVSESGGGYNPNTGSFDEATEVRQTLPCNISLLGIERTANIFGNIETSILVARLQRLHTESFDHVEIDGKPMSVKRHVPHRSESVYYLEGVSL